MDSTGDVRLNARQSPRITNARPTVTGCDVTAATGTGNGNFPARLTHTVSVWGYQLPKHFLTTVDTPLRVRD